MRLPRLSWSTLANTQQLHRSLVHFPLRLGGGWWLAEHYETQFGLSICIVTRIFPAVQIYMGVAAMEPINTLFDGIFITILTVRAHRKCR